MPQSPDVRAFLMHITHYDPVWIKHKDKEKPFAPDVGLEVIEALGKNDYNLLLIDPKDAVEYLSHPELKRHYTQPMDVLEQLAAAARENGLDVGIKLNFSQSGTHQHNHWFSPHHRLFDNDEYWSRAAQIIDELVDAAGVETYFHIGMDEDHDRTIGQFITAVDKLHEILSKRDLKTVMWNDSACHWPQAAVHREKSMAAEEQSAKDIIHVIWDYNAEIDQAAFERCRQHGLEIWGAPGSGVENTRKMLDVLENGQGAGIVMTRWIACRPENRERLLDRIAELPAALASE